MHPTLKSLPSQFKKIYGNLEAKNYPETPAKTVFL